MFDQLRNMGALMGQAKEMGRKLEAMREELASRTVVGESGAGAVRVEVSGDLVVRRVTMDPVMVTALAGTGTDTDREMVEELIASATNAGLEKARQLAQDEMAKLTGGLNIPGLDNLLKS